MDQNISQSMNEFNSKKSHSSSSSSNNSSINGDNENLQAPLANTQIDDEAFKVYVRIRPLNKKELDKRNQRKNPHILKIQDQTVFVMDPDIPLAAGYSRDKSYAFDYVFNENDKTSLVYQNTMEPLIDNILNGYNATLFAYGMTGAGKTHTLFGDMQKETLNSDISGMIMLTFNDIFNRITRPPYANLNEFVIKMSYLEIYNEHVKDLLKGDNQNLMVIEDNIKGVFVADLLEITVNSLRDVLNHILLGNSRRTMASTSANQFSSRSHAIIQVVIEKRNKTKDTETLTISKLSLIDLAGSERATVADNKGLRMLEGANINRSLLSLGNCINILSDQGKKGGFVPYRDSKLTRLLKDSLGGNTKTIMIACISPCCSCYEETVNTLKYASRAKNIKKKIEQNVKEVDLQASQYKEIIEGLKDEIISLKDQLKLKSPMESPKMNNTKKIDFSSPNNTVQNFSSLKEKCNEDIMTLLLSSDSNLQDMTKEIFQNLEKNWEINQKLRKLNDLESQNKQALSLQQKKLESIPQTELKKLESIEQQINLLKSTIQNNERIKKDVENTLKSNILEGMTLREKLAQNSPSRNTHEDIKFARKLLELEKLDVYVQNIELKREALRLVKEKITKDQKILKMEEEIKSIRVQLEEAMNQLASSKVMNQTNIKQFQEESKILERESKILESVSNILERESNKFEKESNILERESNKLERESNILERESNNFESCNFQYSSDDFNSRNEFESELEIHIESKDLSQPKVNLNLDEMILPKSPKPNEEKFSSPSNTQLKRSNNNTRESNNAEKSKKRNGNSNSQGKRNNTDNGNISTAWSPAIEKVSLVPLSRQSRRSNEKQKTNESDSKKDLNQVSSPVSQVKSIKQRIQIHLDAKKDLNNLLNDYPRPDSKILSTKDENQYPYDQKTNQGFNIKPFSPTMKYDSNKRNQGIVREGFKTKRSIEYSQEISLLAKDENLENFNPLCNADSQKENININKIYTSTSTTFEKKPKNSCSNMPNQEIVKLSMENLASQVTQSQGFTSINLKSPTDIDHKRTGSQESLPNPIANTTNQGEIKTLPNEIFRKKNKQPLQGVNNKNLRESLRKSTTSKFDKSSEIVTSRPNIALVEKSLNTSLLQGLLPNKTNITSSIGLSSLIEKPTLTTTTSTNTIIDNKNGIKKPNNIQHLDQDNENLKLFRSKICALSSMNLNEKNNISSSMLKEIRSLIDEYKTKNYVIPIEDQECLRTLGEVISKVDQNNIQDISQQEKDTRVRFASVNLSKPNQPEKKSTAKTNSVSLQRPTTIEPIINQIPVKRIMIKDFLKKESSTKLENGVIQNPNNNNTNNKTPLKSERDSNTPTMSHAVLKNSTSFIKGDKNEINPFDSTKNLPPRYIKISNFGLRDLTDTSNTFKEKFEVIETQPDFYTKPNDKPLISYNDEMNITTQRLTKKVSTKIDFDFQD